MFRMHAWLGLHLCLLLGLIFLSGTFLLFSPELTVANRTDLYISPPEVSAPRASLGDIYDAVSREIPGATIEGIIGEPRPWLGKIVNARDAQRRRIVAWVHPADASLIGVTEKKRFSLRDFVHDLHDRLTIPSRLAHIAVNLLSLFLLLSLISGLITYRRFWKGFLRWPGSVTDARTRYGIWHRTIAVWSVPFLIVIALTGLVFLANALGAKPKIDDLPAPSERSVRLPPGFDGTALDQMVASAEEAYPGFEAAVAGLPRGPARPLRLTGKEDGSPSIFGVVVVELDPVTGEVLGIKRNTEGNLMSKLHALSISLHFGNFGGFWSIALWVVFGLGSTLLLFTGAKVYALKSIAARRGDEGPPWGTFGILWQGLGVFRWLYVGAAGAVVISTVLRAAG